MLSILGEREQAHQGDMTRLVSVAIDSAVVPDLVVGAEDSRVKETHSTFSLSCVLSGDTFSGYTLDNTQV